MWGTKGQCLEKLAAGHSLLHHHASNSKHRQAAVVQLLVLPAIACQRSNSKYCTSIDEEMWNPNADSGHPFPSAGCYNSNPPKAQSEVHAAIESPLSLLRQCASNKLPRLHLDELRRISRLQAQRVEAEVTRNVVRADLPVHLQTYGRTDDSRQGNTSSLAHASTRPVVR